MLNFAGGFSKCKHANTASPPYAGRPNSHRRRSARRLPGVSRIKAIVRLGPSDYGQVVISAVIPQFADLLDSEAAAPAAAVDRR
jgi:hypothetical protein